MWGGGDYVAKTWHLGWIKNHVVISSPVLCGELPHDSSVPNLGISHCTSFCAIRFPVAVLELSIVVTLSRIATGGGRGVVSKKVPRVARADVAVEPVLLVRGEME